MQMSKVISPIPAAECFDVLPDKCLATAGVVWETVEEETWQPRFLPHNTVDRDLCLMQVWHLTHDLRE